MADSYDLLAESIERVIRSDLPPPTSEEELAGRVTRDSMIGTGLAKRPDAAKT